MEKKTNLEITLITPEDEKSNEVLLKTLSEQVEKAQESEVALEIKEIVSTMTLLPESFVDVTKEELAKVREDKNTLVKIRTGIKASGKKARDLHNGINKSISAYENKIVELTEEEELKRKNFIEEVQQCHLQTERKKSLPEFIEKLKVCAKSGSILDVLREREITYDGILNDSNLGEYILTLDTTQRDAFYNECFAKKLELDAQAIEDQKEEDRLAKIAEDEALEKKKEDDKKIRLENLKKEREKELPKRKERLDSIKDTIPLSDDALNGMDDNQFEAYYNQRVSDKNTADSQKIEKDKENEAQKQAEKLKKEEDDRLAGIKADARKIFVEDMDILNTVADCDDFKETRSKDFKYDFESFLLQERRDILEKMENEEKSKLVDKKYQAFLKDNGYTEKTKDQFKIIDGPTLGSIILWKKVGEYKPEE